MIVPTWVWIAFVGFVLTMLTLDLFVFHRKAHAVSSREAAMWVAIWVSMGVGFTFAIWAWYGGAPATEYISGYLLEYSLSADNIFVFVLIFSYFAVPQDLQHRVLFWGILGALVFRAGFIALGYTLLERFHFMFYVFGGFLLLTGIRLMRHGEVEVHPEKNIVLRGMRRLFPMTPAYHGQKFFIRENGKRFATPLLAVLVVVETTDIIFAVDSIPAIFGVTEEPFLVFTSNAFAIMGLRALYFLLANMVRRFQYLQVGLALILVFIGAKMILDAAGIYHMHVAISLGFIVTALTVSVIASLRAERGSPSTGETLPERGEGLQELADDDAPDEPPDEELGGPHDEGRPTDV